MNHDEISSDKIVGSEWLSAPPKLTLYDDEIHIWRCYFEQPRQTLESLTETLDGDEVTRAGRFRFQNGKHNFIVARGVLRMLLGQYLKTEPAAIRFRYGRQGKPSLAGGMNANICFNVSHSRDVALYAFAHDRKVGVDIEYISADRTFEDLAERFFNSNEVSSLKAFPNETQRDAFFKLWTCKEAFLKAIGTGLSFGLDKVEIDITTGTGPVIASIKGDADEAASWTVQSLDVASGYAAALVADGPVRDIKCWKWGNGPV